MSSKDVKKLIKRTLQGEKEAFEMIVKMHQQPLLNYISRMIPQRELALDISQDVFIKAYSSLETYQTQYKFNTWLFKIASNALIDYWRKKRIKAVSYDSSHEEDSFGSMQIPDKQCSVVKKLELAELGRKIESALEKLPPALRELFILRHVNQFSYEEIAEIRSLPIGTVKNRVFRAKEMIRELLEGVT